MQKMSKYINRKIKKSRHQYPVFYFKNYKMLFGWPKNLCVKNFHFRTFRAIFRAKGTYPEKVFGRARGWLVLLEDR